ncbi:nicotinamide riboside kinase 1 [Leptinotarsa decemlineata]|uniref:nicotinamide riboside kinase 1 n=1 Tax=Leptinotarsa decemlineata TaxID=7539 RepID=UPI000C253248|nr:nicotinamide riboside kinase 1 isoform X2 [Leptinotarsa decemlineata]
MCENRERNLIVIGISGVTCGGKTTTATKLANLLPNCKIIGQDDYFLVEDDPRHTWIPELNHVNYDTITSLDMDQMYEDLLEIINKFKRKGVLEESKNSANQEAKENCISLTRFKDSNVSFLIVEGFSIFNFKPLLPLFHLKYYFVLDKDKCLERREKRAYEPPDCPGYFEKCVWPEHLAQLKEVKTFVKNVCYFDGDSELDIIQKILADITEYLKSST